jgi:hypothetical protein
MMDGSLLISAERCGDSSFFYTSSFLTVSPFKVWAIPKSNFCFAHRTLEQLPDAHSPSPATELHTAGFSSSKSPANSTPRISGLHQIQA